jgi:hypothetical protein
MHPSAHARDDAARDRRPGGRGHADRRRHRGSRAEILRWAISRVREHPAYAQLQERVHEISQLKAQF